MRSFVKHSGVVAAMDRANVDTDQIIPKQFLKRIERSGFGQFLFFDWRFLENGDSNPQFELNLPRTKAHPFFLPDAILEAVPRASMRSGRSMTMEFAA